MDFSLDLSGSETPNTSESKLPSANEMAILVSPIIVAYFKPVCDGENLETQLSVYFTSTGIMNNIIFCLYMNFKDILDPKNISSTESICTIS